MKAALIMYGGFALVALVLTLVGCGGERHEYDPATVIEMVGGADVLQVEGPFVLVRDDDRARCLLIDTSTQYQDDERPDSDDFWAMTAVCP